jgi:mono/diheme cytochrome c family protein
MDMRYGMLRVGMLGMVVCVAPLMAGCSGSDGARPGGAATQAGPATTATDLAERGKYLVDGVGGCHDCHTPMKMGPNGPEPDMSIALSGHPAGLLMPPPPPASGPWIWHGAATNTAFAGPWGVSYAINLTPDEDTGIGTWTEQVFVNSLKTGRHMGIGRPIMPPMPWQAYSRMTDEDLRAMYAYLRSVPAKTNKVPEAVVAEPPAAPAP